MQRQDVLGLALGGLGIGIGALGATFGESWLLWPAALAVLAGLTTQAVSLARLGRHRAEAAEMSDRLVATQAELAAEQAARRDAEERLSSRMQLTAMRRSNSDDQLTDRESGLYSEAYFRVALDARIASARRNLNPLAVAVVDPVRGLATAAPTPAPVRATAEAIVATVREADTVCRLADGSFALILDDTDENGAIWTVERIRRAIADTDDAVTLWAGVACYPAHGLTTEEILDRADVALDAAREWRQDRIEVAGAES
ncbi:MAG: diguanylate cyclase [Acidimicrobiia bacterium]|nr:diguanylate cyclase [Acidimicrobiia bacterium]